MYNRTCNHNESFINKIKRIHFLRKTYFEHNDAFGGNLQF
jgi:hypothetical protein